MKYKFYHNAKQKKNKVLNRLYVQKGGYNYPKAQLLKVLLHFMFIICVKCVRQGLRTLGTLCYFQTGKAADCQNYGNFV